MQRDKLFSIITIICYCTVILVPMALVLMWFYTNWKKITKIILSVVTTVLYVALVLLVLKLEPSYNTSGIHLPFGNSNSGYTAFEASSSGKKKNEELKGENSESKPKDKFDELMEEEEERLPKSLKKNKGGIGFAIYPILFFLFMLALIVLQNLRRGKKNTYENPYVDTNKYKLPLEDDAHIPMVHYLRLRMNQNEKILYATETTQKDSEGDFIVTNQRVVVFSLGGDYEFPLNTLTAVSSVTNTVMLLTSGERKYYIFMPESQMKYALAIVRWAYKKSTEQTV